MLVEHHDLFSTCHLALPLHTCIRPHDLTSCFFLEFSPPTTPELPDPLKHQLQLSEVLEIIDSLCVAAWEGDSHKFNNIVLSCSKPSLLVNQVNQRGQSPLYCAAHEGQAAIVLQLLNMEGIDFNCQVTGHKGTALHGTSQ